MFLACLFGGLAVTGTKVLPVAMRDQPHRYAVGLGLGLFGLITLFFALGSLGLLSRPLLWSLVVGALAYSFYSRLGVPRWSLRALPLTPFEWALLGLFVMAAISHLLFGYAPPTGEDELGYQIALPLLYAQKGKWVVTPDNPLSYYPLNFQLLLAGLIVWRGAMIAKAAVWATGLFSASALWIFTCGTLKRDRRVAWLAVTLFYTAPLVTSLSGITSADLLSIAFALLTFSVACSVQNDASLPRLWVMSALSAAGMGTRPYALAWVAAVAVAMVILDRRPKAAFLYLVFTGFLYSPWPIRNFILTGNPVYPQFIGHGFASDPFFAAMGQRDKTAFSTVFWIPWVSTLNANTFLWGSGPLLMAFLPAAWLKPDPSGTRTRLTVLAVLTLLFTFLFPLHGSRYFGAGYALLAILAAMGVNHLLVEGGFTKRVVQAIVLLILLVPQSLLGIYFAAKRVPYVMGRQSADAYLQQNYTIYEGYAMMQFIHEHVPAGSAIHYIGLAAPPTFYYSQWPMTATPRYAPAFYEQSAQQMARQLTADGVAYLLVQKNALAWNPDGSSTYTGLPALPIHFPAWKAPWFEKVAETEDSFLFKVATLV